MPSKKRKVTKVNVWQKHAEAIKKSGVKTITELVAKLRPAAGKKPLIEGVTTDEASEMLIDIGLRAFPFGFLFSDEVRRQFKGSIEEIDRSSMLTALENILKREDLDERNSKYLRETIKHAKSRKIQDPFKSSTPLMEHPAIFHVFKKTIFDEVAQVLDIGDKELTKLKQHFRTRDHFMKSENKNIKKVTGTAETKIEKTKEIFHWMGTNVSVSFANALVTMSLKKPDLISMNNQDLKNIINKSKITVPREELTHNYLDQVIASARTSVPEMAYFNDVISSLKLPDKAYRIIKNKKIKSFRDLRKNGLLFQVITEGNIKDKRVVSKLKAHYRLAMITTNLDLNMRLINDNIYSAYKVSRIPIKEFQKKYKRIATKDELAQAHKNAVQIAGRAMTIASWAYLTTKKLNVDNMLPAIADARRHSEQILKGGIS